MPSGDSRPRSHPSYFLVSVSTRKNLDLCIKYALAGFPGGVSGAWTFCEIQEGDFISFLYGARAHNLYQVSGREALHEPERLPPPWEPLTFGKKNKVYFPFRLHLRPIRVFDEPLVRPEFAYVAENLLRRGGYSKTHFQADQTTLQSVSGMGTVAEKHSANLEFPEHSSFIVRFSRTKSLTQAPEVLRFTEMILQSAIRRHLASEDNLQTLLADIGLNKVHAEALEVLGEKALAEGHIDLLLKERVPLGSAMKIPIVVKTKGATPRDVEQLRNYMAELQGESPVAILVAEDFGKKAIAEANNDRIRLVRYEIRTDLRRKASFEEIYQSLSLKPLTK